MQRSEIKIRLLLRWDSQGNLLLTGRVQAQQERQRAEKLAERLWQMGVNPDEV
ncbi:MAG: hypothetical protein AB1589_30705 [Cyanobacteriota bacterium]